MKAAGLNIAEWRNYTVYKAEGCEECNGTGYKGRLAIHEALYFTKAIRQLIVKSGDEVDEESIRIQAKKDGSSNLREAGLEKVKLGLTSIHLANHIEHRCNCLKHKKLKLSFNVILLLNLFIYILSVEFSNNI